MTGHMVNDTIDPGVPASLSPSTVEGLLRNRLGWTGVTITDDLGAEAIVSRYKRPEALALAIEAGNDLLLFANQTIYEPDLAAQLVDTIEELVVTGRIAEARIAESIRRIDAFTLGIAVE
jgi:beta-N-acetylhexosaminidase